MADKMESWKCECGQIEHGEYPPQECSACWKPNSFNRVQDEDGDLIEDLL